MNLTRAGLQSFVDEGWINSQKHPTEDLWIYNYSKTCGFSRHWTPETLACRGLIIDSEDRIVARPLAKFWNLEEHDATEEFLFAPFKVSAKLDGSLGIHYQVGYNNCVATRGSFTSEQALHATEILQTKYPAWIAAPGTTTLWEIIFPKNRIVVDYEDLDDLILIAVIDNETGTDLDLAVADWGGPVAQQIDAKNLKPSELLQTLGTNDGTEEGFVLRFEHKGQTPRVKVKLDEYKRLHRIITGTSNKTIWEALSQGRSLEEILDRVPDEFNQFVKATINDLNSKFNRIIIDSSQEFMEIARSLKSDWTRKDFAELAAKSSYRGLLFMILDGKSIDDAVWKMIRPEYSRPFANDVDA